MPLNFQNWAKYTFPLYKLVNLGTLLLYCEANIVITIAIIDSELAVYQMFYGTSFYPLENSMNKWLSFH